MAIIIPILSRTLSQEKLSKILSAPDEMSEHSDTGNGAVIGV